MNRREFLKVAAAMGVTFAVPYEFPGRSSAETQGSDQQAFLRLVEEYVDAFYQFHPIRGPESGNHTYDGLGLDDLSPQSLARELESVRDYERRLSEIAPSQLGTDLAIDHALLGTNIAARRDELEVTKTYAHNPFYYADIVQIGILFQMMFEYAGTTRSSRLQVVFRQLDSIPALMENAMRYLQSVAPELLDYGIASLGDLESFLKDDVRTYFADATLPDGGAADTALDTRIATAWDAISRLIVHLERLQDAPDPKPSFALGEVGLAKRLRLREGIALPADKPFAGILARALAELEKDKAAFAKIAHEIDPEQDALAVWEEVQTHHPKPGEVVSVIQAQVDAIVKFLKDKNIIAVPADETIQVTVAPEFMLYWYASAWCTGPFEPKPAPPAVYYVSDPKGILSDADADEFLKDIVTPEMWSTSAHEAYPGHMLQGYALRQVKREQVDTGNLSLVAVSNVFYPYSFGEGWAVYCEQMVREAGLLQDAEPRAYREYLLGQLSDSRLGRTKNYAGIRMQLGEMSLAEAADFIERNAFVGTDTAYKYAQRLAYEPDAILYGIGKMALVQLREDYKEAVEARGETFSLREYHDRLLSLGQYPIPVLRQKMLPGDTRDLIR
jgi:hypothetical protein